MGSDLETAQNQVYSSVASQGFSPECAGAAIQSSYNAFEVARLYGADSEEMDITRDYETGELAMACPRSEISSAMEEVDKASELGGQFFGN